MDAAIILGRSTSEFSVFKPNSLSFVFIESLTLSFRTMFLFHIIDLFPTFVMDLFRLHRKKTEISFLK